MLGLKTEKDLVPVSKTDKKTAKVGTVDKSSAKTVAKDQSGTSGPLTILDVMKKVCFHAPGENYKTDGYIMTPNTHKLLKEHLKFTGGKVCDIEKGVYNYLKNI